MERLQKMAIHEASHAIVAYLFRDYLDLQQVTISRKLLAGETDPEIITASNSGEMKRFDPEAYMAYGITCLAGMIGQTIASVGRENVINRKQEILGNVSLIDLGFGSADMQNFTNTSSVNDHKYGMNAYSYQQFCISFLIDFLTVPQVWDAVEKFSEAILAKSDERLDCQELELHFKSSGYEEALKSVSPEFILRIQHQRLDNGSHATTD